MKETIEEKLLEIQKEKSECLSYNTCPVCDSPEGHKTVESLIEELLQSQTQEIKKKIKMMEKDYENREVGKEGFCQGCSYLQCKCLGYNQALSDILEEI